MSLGKLIATVVLLLSLLALCLYVNRGCFASDELVIFSRPDTRPGAGVVRGRPSAALPLVFGFNDKVQLKSVRVYRADELLTNKTPSALWELISTSNSAPVKLISYGVPVRGLQLRVPQARPEPLEPGVMYVLQVETTKHKGEHVFTAKARPR